MRPLDDLIRAHLKDFEPYSSARDENGGLEVMLDANENAFGSVAGDSWNRYPDPYQKSLKKAISGILGIESEKVFIGNGSDEPIDLLISTFCEPGTDNILVCPPTYSMYQVTSKIRNVGVESVPLLSNFQLDVNGIFEKLTKGLNIIFLCSPNNPTGNSLKKEDILTVIKEFDGLVVLDEAYIDYADQESFLKYVDHYPNLIILRTFSKAWGLAAYRLGMAIAHPEIISILSRVKAPYNISGLVQQKALSALMNFQKKDQWVSETIIERNRLVEEMSFFESIDQIYPSDSNFLLVKFKEAKHAFQVFLNEGVVVRDRSGMLGCENCLRITVGTRLENDKLLTAMSGIS